MQHDNFRNLNRVIFTHSKYLESRVSGNETIYGSLFDKIDSHSQIRTLLKYCNCLICGVTKV